MPDIEEQKLKLKEQKMRTRHLVETPTVFKDLILTTDLTKVYPHGSDN